MLKDITLGQYYPADSVIHKLEPRVKLFATILYIVSLFLFHDLLSPNLFLLKTQGCDFHLLYTIYNQSQNNRRRLESAHDTFHNGRRSPGGAEIFIIY